MSNEKNTQTVTTQSDSNESATVDNASENKTGSKKSTGIIFILLIMFMTIGATLAGAYYFWDLQNKQHASMAQQQQLINRVDTRISKLILDIKTSNSAVTNNAQALETLSKKIQQTETISQQAIEIVNRNQRDWAMAEVDYLLRIAHQRIAVAKDIGGAIAALKGADSRIQQLGDLTLFDIRKQLALDIANLNAIHQADVNGISLSLDQMIANLQSLPFKSTKDEIQIQFSDNDLVEQPKSEEKTFVDSMIETVKQIGDIKVHKNTLKAASSEVQKNSIEQLLRTHLLGARLAALRFSQTQFLHEINQASELLRLHYDVKDNRVQAQQENLLNYSALQLNPDLPELTKAWTLLQNKMTSTTLKTVKSAVTEKNKEAK